MRKSFTQPNRARAAGFTLMELLIVMGIIVLLVSMAVPAFNYITGTRSQDGAQNQIAAILGRARSEAIGMQEERGVLFYVDPVVNRVTAAIVRSRPDVPTPNANIEVVVDLLPGREQVQLPNGVGLHMISNGGGQKYMGYNKVNTTGKVTEVAYGGVILFDAFGRLEHRTYAFLIADSEKAKPTAAAKPRWTQMGQLLFNQDDPTASPPGPPSYVTPPFLKKATDGANFKLYSQIGFVLYDYGQFISRGLSTDDAVAGEPTEETFINDNGLPFIIGRYNGTLVRGE